MSIVRYYFKKNGGLSLLKQYWRAGVLFDAICQFFLLGRDQTSLLMLREIIALKIQKNLQKKYSFVFKNINKEYIHSLPHDTSRIVWIFWWQGEEAMPPLVRKCYESVKKNMKDWEIILITEKNYLQYADFPTYILEKLQKGITLTHFSDLLRLELLIKHGGLWLDATVLCTNGEIPMSILSSDLFVYRTQKPGADGKAITMSSWLMWAKTNHRILMATQAMLYAYWKKNNKLNEYFLLHHFMTITMDFYKEDASKIPPFCNSIPHILLLHLFDQYDEQYWNDLKQKTCFHKLSYKLEENKCKEKGTYYDKIINLSHGKK